MFLRRHQKTAIIWKDQQISYEALLGHIDFFAEAFSSKNYRKAAIFSENRPEWAYAFYAAWRNGCIAVPVDFMSTAEDLAYILEDCRPELIFCSRGTHPVLEAACGKISYDIDIRVFEDMKQPAEIQPGTSFPECDPMKTAAIIYTSGTTGSPKGVMLSYDNLLANIESVSEEVKIFTPDDRVMVLLPLNHIFPLLGSLILPLYVGGTAVFCPSMASEDLMDTLQRHGITIIIGVPRLYSLIRKSVKDKIQASLLARGLFALAGAIGSFRFSRMLFKKVHEKLGGNIRFLVSGGAKLDEEVGRDLKTLGLEVLEGFGMTEAAPMISFTRPGEVLVGSAGRPMTCNEVKIVDGEILAKGRNVMQGYYNRPEETLAVVKDGWLHTGDLGYLDDRGLIHITGRKKEIIVLPNGKNVNPVEIERRIAAMSECIAEVGVYFSDNVLQAVVLPDFRKVRELGISNLNETLRQEVFDSYNRSEPPYRRIMRHHVLTGDLPKTRLGKIKRFMLSSLAGDASRDRDKGKEPDFEEYAAIRDFLREQTEKDIFPEDHFEIDLGLDSLDRVGLQAFLQASFGIEVGEEDLLDHPTVKKLSLYIREKKKKISVSVVQWAEIFREKADVVLPRSWPAHNFVKNLARYVLGSYFRLRVKGLENLPKEPFVVVPNHQSFLDGLFVISFLKNSLNKNTYFYAKKKHVQKSWLKFLAIRNNVIVMDISKDLKASLQKLAEVLRQGKNIIIFPEGTRTKDGRIGGFKKTFAILSRELNVPVVPVAIQGAFEALPAGTVIPKPYQKIQVSFLDPIYPDGHTYDSLNDLVFQKISSELASLTGQSAAATPQHH
ncbi:MAG: AMP-binding protein [Desulfobacterales bacterium]|nr:AMP-binding protein [Desulfobacterales bacterium]